MFAETFEADRHAPAGMAASFVSGLLYRVSVILCRDASLTCARVPYLM
jgi:hypothetical protein